MGRITLSPQAEKDFRREFARVGIELDDILKLCVGEVPPNWRVYRHVGPNKVEENPKMMLHLSPKQQGEAEIKGDLLLAELDAKHVPVANACHLDYFRAHPETIPEEWKVDEKNRTRFIFFWGTIFCSPNGRLYVCYMCWFGTEWTFQCCCLEGVWSARCPAAILENPLQS
jgi:hypothetical protein